MLAVLGITMVGVLSGWSLWKGAASCGVGLAVFAFPEMIDPLRKSGTIATGAKLGRGWLDGLKDMLRHRWLCLRCAGIGTLIGAIPGLGGSVVDWIAYGHVVQTARDKSQFRTGDIRGVLAPESANNAKERGGLILIGLPGVGLKRSSGFTLAGILSSRGRETAHNHDEERPGIASFTPSEKKGSGTTSYG